MYFISFANSEETDKRTHSSAPDWRTCTKSWNWTAVIGHPRDNASITYKKARREPIAIEKFIIDKIMFSMFSNFLHAATFVFAKFDGKRWRQCVVVHFQYGGYSHLGNFYMYILLMRDRHSILRLYHEILLCRFHFEISNQAVKSQSTIRKKWRRPGNLNWMNILHSNHGRNKNCFFSPDCLVKSTIWPDLPIGKIS